MDKLEFVERMVGVEWKHRRYDFGGVDCHGLVILYYREVLGIDIGVPPGYHDDRSMQDCWHDEEQSGKWEQVDRPAEDTVVFTCYNGDRPAHVGIMISRTHALHCRGSIDEPGRVEVHKIKVLERMAGRVTFHRYKG